MRVPQEVTDLVAGSGHNFHAKVARWMQADGWHVSISPYYLDQTQNKAREIDLVAEKLWPIKSPWRGDPIGDVAVRLYMECKFVPSHSVFWFTDKDVDAATSLVCSRGSFRPDNTYTQKHHYLAHSRRVAKLFATSSGRSTENDPYFRALNQVLNAMVSMRGTPLSLPDLSKRGTTPAVVLEFPIVVCSTFQQMYGVDFYAESEPEQIADNFQLEIRYAYPNSVGRQITEYLLLDFVEFDQLNIFAAGIALDANTAAFFAAPS
jgi:hypothetical protein